MYVCNATIHTYIWNWSLQPFSQDYDRASDTTYVVCVRFMHEWWGIQFKVNSKRHIVLRNISWQILYLLSEFLPEICLEEVDKRNIFFHISYS